MAMMVDGHCGQRLMGTKAKRLNSQWVGLMVNWHVVGLKYSVFDMRVCIRSGTLQLETGTLYTDLGTPWPKTGTPFNVMLHIFLNNFSMGWNIKIIFSDSFGIEAA